MRIFGVLAALVAIALVWVGITAFQPAAASPSSKTEKFEEDLPVIVPEGPQPKVVVTPSLEHNFGEMRFGDIGKHTFTITNKGEGDLKMKTLATTCKCTLSDMEDTVLSPGESLDVELTWEPKNPAEDFAQTAFIKTNDPDVDQLELSIRGRVATEVIIQPGPVWDVGTVSEEESSPTEFVGAVASELSDDLTVTGIKDGAVDWVSIDVQPFTDEQLEMAAAESSVDVRSGAGVVVTVKPGMDVGRFRVPVTLLTNSETEPEVQIEVAGTRTGPFTMLGPGWSGGRGQLSITPFKASEGKTVRLAMMVEPSDELIELTDVNVQPPVLDVTLTRPEKYEVGGRHKYDLVVTIPPGVKPGIYENGEDVVVSAGVKHPKFDRLNFAVNFRARP